MEFKIEDWLDKQLVSGVALKKIRKHRGKDYIYDTDVPVCDIEDREREGWEVYKHTKKNRVTLRKEKLQSAKFEDRVWRLFEQMGYEYLNEDNHCLVPNVKPYDATNLRAKQCHQIDVLALDEDCVFIIECKSAETNDKLKNFRNEIERLHANFPHFRSAIQRACPELENAKYKAFFVTQRYKVSKDDIELMSKYGIQYLDEDDLTYYEQLAAQLGSASKYQFCAHVFRDIEIKGMFNEVPAIKGKMGGHEYYSFSIEPERLLKMSYIAHRRKGDTADASTYQRLIKKERLQSVRAFVNNNNFFPNSIIVNVTNERRNGRALPMQFRITKEQAKGTESQLGILELPQRYGCAFVIDGQHRLYGYSDSKYARSNTIPVVLFENLSVEEQIKLFMDINQNQKSVPKELKNTLSYILYSDSKDPKKRQEAMMLRIATDLGSDPQSPLCNYIKLLEHESSAVKKLTTTAIHNGLKDTPLFDRYVTKGKNQTVEHGIFFQEDQEMTRRYVYNFLVSCFNHIHDECVDEWELGGGTTDNPGILTINNSITAILKVIGTIASTIVKKKNINPVLNRDEFTNHALYYLDSLNRYIQNMPLEEKLELRKHLGAAAPDYYAMIFKHAIYKERNDLDIDVDAMTAFFENETRKYNTATFEILSQLKPLVRKFVIRVLKGEHPVDNWLLESVPTQVYKKLGALYSEYQIKHKDDKTARLEDMLDFEHFPNVLSKLSAETVKTYLTSNKLSVSKIKEMLIFIGGIAKMNLSKESVKMADYERLKSHFEELSLVMAPTKQ